MELPPSTFTSRLSTSALQLIDRPFDHRPIRKKRFHQAPDLVGQMKKTLPKLTEFLSIPFTLYAHSIIAYRYRRKTQEKNEPTKKIPHPGIEKSLSRRNSDPWQDYERLEVFSFKRFLLSESQLSR